MPRQPDAPTSDGQYGMGSSIMTPDQAQGQQSPHSSDPSYGVPTSISPPTPSPQAPILNSPGLHNAAHLLKGIASGNIYQESPPAFSLGATHQSNQKRSEWNANTRHSQQEASPRQWSLSNNLATMKSERVPPILPLIAANDRSSSFQTQKRDPQPFTHQNHNSPVTMHTNERNFQPQYMRTAEGQLDDAEDFDVENSGHNQEQVAVQQQFEASTSQEKSKTGPNLHQSFSQNMTIGYKPGCNENQRSANENSQNTNVFTKNIASV